MVAINRLAEHDLPEPPLRFTLADVRLVEQSCLAEAVRSANAAWAKGFVCGGVVAVVGSVAGSLLVSYFGGS